jgi:hypothetical protein
MFGTLLLSGIFVILGAVAAVSVGFTFYPYSIAQWLWGLEQHASAVVYVREGWLNLDQLLRAYVISTGRLMMGGIFLVVVALTIYHLWRTQEARKVQKFGSIGLVVCVAALAVRFTTISGFYNMLCLFPIGVAVAASTLGTQSYSLNTVGKLLKNCFFACLLISTADPLLLQLGSLLGYKGMPLLEARRLFSNDMKTMPGDITLSMDLAVLSDRTDRLQTIYKYVPPCEEPDTPWLVVQQFSYSYSEPPSYTSYRLVKNRFVDIKKMPGRLQQWFGAPGYGYAIYKKEDRQLAAMSMVTNAILNLDEVITKN